MAPRRAAPLHLPMPLAHSCPAACLQPQQSFMGDQLTPHVRPEEENSQPLGYIFAPQAGLPIIWWSGDLLMKGVVKAVEVHGLRGCLPLS